MKKIVPMFSFCSPGNVHLPVKVAAASPVLLPCSEFPMIHKYMSEGWQPELDAHGPDVNKYRKLPGATQQIEVNKNSFTFHSQDTLPSFCKKEKGTQDYGINGTKLTSAIKKEPIKLITSAIKKDNAVQKAATKDNIPFSMEAIKVETDVTHRNYSRYSGKAHNIKHFVDFRISPKDLLNGGNMKYSRFPKCKMRGKFRRYYQHPSPDLKHYTSPDIEIIEPENEKKRDLQCNICCLTFRFGSSFCSHLKGERHRSCEKLLKNFYLKYHKNVHVSDLSGV